jgi:hypothetical protein
MRALLRFFRALGPAFERAHLRWAQREIHPLHPDVTFIVTRLAELESRQ